MYQVFINYYDKYKLMGKVMNYEYWGKLFYLLLKN